MSDKYFKKALADFTFDFASADAIRLMAGKGLTVKEIQKRLDFPTPIDKIAEIVWKHYVDTGVILLEDPRNGTQKRFTYEKVQDGFGRVSFKQVVSKNTFSDKEFIPCDFGLKMFKDKKAFEKSLEELSGKDRDYILCLPWPPRIVWHEKNERLSRIIKTLGGTEK